MLTRLIYSPFARCYGLFLLVLILAAVTIAPTIGSAQAQGTGTGLGIMPPEAVAGGSEAVNGSQGALNRAGAFEPRTAVGLDIGFQPYFSPLVIPAADFRNDGQAPTGYFFNFANGYIESQGGTVYMMAPAYLPRSATVTQMVATLFDNGGTIRSRVQFYRVNKDSGVVDMMASVSTTSTSGTIQQISDSTITNPTVVYPDYSYYLGAGLFNSSHRIYSVRVYYTLP